MQKRKWYADGDSLVLHRTEDLSPALRRAELARELHGETHNDNRPMFSIPTIVIETWLREAGLTLDDREAVQDLVMKKMRSGEFEKFTIKDKSNKFFSLHGANPNRKF